MSNEINRMFSSIAKNYDKVNKMISLGADVRWRKQTAKMCLSSENNLKILDTATGTADLAIAIAYEAQYLKKKVSIVGLDFNDDMLKLGEKKIRERKLNQVITLLDGDSQSTVFENSSFDVITSGFALRNFDDLYKFLKESYRILKPGGKIVFLDAARPDSPFSDIMRSYMTAVIPTIGAKYNRSAYTYLVSSIWKFDRDKLVHYAKQVGFKNVKITNLSFGIVYVITGKKPKAK